MRWPVLVIGALLAGFLMSGWRTANDASRDEEVKQQLKWVDRDAVRLVERVSALERRVKALEVK